MDIPDSELQKLASWKYQSRKQRIVEDCNGVCIPKMMKYLQLVHHLLTFQYVSSQISVRMMLAVLTNNSYPVTSRQCELFKEPDSCLSF
jgi:hypothetical protein